MEPPTPKGDKKGSRREFSASKPLPPIGLSDLHEYSGDDERQSDGARSARSSVSQGSTTAFDRVGEGSARPRIIRGFRPEVYSDDEDFENDKKLDRRVSFNAAKQRVFRSGSPTQMEVTRRTTYDGREISFVTLNTQTDWDWVSEVESGTARTVESDRPRKEEKVASVTPRKDAVEETLQADEDTPRRGSTFQMPYNDEYGIPILDLSSDTDDHRIKAQRSDIGPSGAPVVKPESRGSKSLPNLGVVCERLSSDMQKSDLQNLDLKSSDLQKTDLLTPESQSSDSKSSDLQSSDLQRSDLQKTEMPSLDLQKPELQNLDSKSSDLQKSDLQKTELQSSDSKSSDLKQSDLQKSDLQKSDLQKPDIQDLDSKTRKISGVKSLGSKRRDQYQRESEKQEIGVEDPESRLPKSEDAGSEYEMEKDADGLPHGMFSGKCEFCHKHVKAFPTLEQQLQLPPEELYCCNDYREFVEYVLMTTHELEEEQKNKTKMISIKVHDHVGSKQERNAAKEKAVQRMRERELQRRAQEATGLQQNFFASLQMAGIGGTLAGYKSMLNKMSPFTMKDVYADHFDGAHNKRTSIISKYAGSTTLSLGPGRVPSHLSGFSSHLISGHHSPGSVVSQLIGTPVPGALGGNAVPEKASLANAGGSPSRSRLNAVPSEIGGAWEDGMKYAGLAGPLMNKPVNLKNVEATCVGDCLVARKKGVWEKAMGQDGCQGHGHGHGHGAKSGGSSGRIERHSDYCDSFRLWQYIAAYIEALRKRVAVARQMKTINYQLSSQKCLEEGWTLRAPSPLLEDLGDNVFEPEPLDPAMIAEGRLRERPLIEKFYETGQKFLTMFPDGTGNVFYPSGNLAILISSIKLGQYNYTVHQDVARSAVAAAFEPSGYGYCYFPNGEIRLYIDQYGGIELDDKGGKKRKWQWKDHVTHVHAPPFQPICIGLNRHLAVRVMSQENIAVTFSANQRSCRFNMGSRLKTSSRCPTPWDFIWDPEGMGIRVKKGRGKELTELKDWSYTPWEVLDAQESSLDTPQDLTPGVKSRSHTPGEVLSHTPGKVSPEKKGPGKGLKSAKGKETELEVGSAVENRWESPREAISRIKSRSNTPREVSPQKKGVGKGRKNAKGKEKELEFVSRFEPSQEVIPGIKSWSLSTGEIVYQKKGVGTGPKSAEGKETFSAFQKKGVGKGPKSVKGKETLPDVQKKGLGKGPKSAKGKETELELVAPENVPLKEIDEDHIFLEEKKNYVGTLLDKVTTLLKYPNSARVDKILPPLHVTNKIVKTEKLKQERKSLIAQQSARDKKQAPISVS